MKKNYFLTLLLTLCISAFSFGQDLIITGAFDGPNTGGLPKGVELYVVNDIGDLSIYGIGSANNGGGTDGVEFTFPADAVTAGTFIYVASEVTGFTAFFGVAPDYDAGSAMGINGDDAVELFKNAVVVDTFGDINKDGTGEPWDHLDGWAYRKDATGPDGGFVLANWTFSGINKLEGGSTNGATTSPFPKGTYKETASSTPELTITSPTEGSTISYTATATVKFTVENFTVAAASAGDGYIKWKLDDAAQADKTDTNDITFAATAGTTYKVYIELVDNSGAALGTPVNQTVNFTVDFPCDLVLGTIATSCDASTSGTDTYSGTIAFTGGNTGATYTITAPAGVVVGGDNPDSVAAGTITFTGMTEGVDAAITIVGGATSSCDYARTLYSPTCIAFPVIEHFDYTDASNLGDQSTWTKLNSGDDMLVATGNLDYTGLEASTGNKIMFSESGSETYTEFNDITTGTVYASFLLKVTAFQAGSSPDLTDGGYIASLAGGTSSYDARLWVRPNPDTSGSSFDIGFGAESSSPAFTSGTYALNDVLLVVMAYNMDTALMSVWINPNSSSFEGTIPTATLSSTDTNPPSAIRLFMLRQDSSNETPFIEVDALRISNSWADVTPKGVVAAVEKNNIDGFMAYPNPVNDGRLTIATLSSDEKEVTIYNVLGKRVFAQKFSGNNKQLDVSYIKSGIYIMKVLEGDKVATKKLVIR